MDNKKQIIRLVKLVYKRTKKGDKICLRCYIDEITSLLTDLEMRHRPENER